MNARPRPYPYDAMVLKAENYGTRVHAEANHLYGDRPYSYHLEAVFTWVWKWDHLVTPEQAIQAQAAAWVHDAIEDARQTYNDMVAELGVPVAEIAYACATLKGRTRAERAGAAYYAGIVAAGPAAILVKLCDRLANVTEAVASGSRMAKVYGQEMDHFLGMLLPTLELKTQFRSLIPIFYLSLGIPWKPSQDEVDQLAVDLKRAREQMLLRCEEGRGEK